MAVPVLLLTGFLGAGKTTVLNHLLQHAGGRRFAVLVNDFGSINIDAALLAGSGDGVVSLANGCICCSLEGDLLRALAAVLRREPRPEAIVIEPSGVADPSEIVRNLMDPVVARAVSLDAVVCVVDAAAGVAALEDAAPRGQVRAADIVLLSKTDLADAGAVAGVRAAVAALCPRAVLVEAVHGAVPVALLFPDERGPAPVRAPGRAGPVAERFESLSWTGEAPLDVGRLQRAIGQLAPRLARAKGLFEAAGQPGRRLVLQLAGGRATIAPAGQAELGAGSAGAPRAQFVFVAEIGRLDAEAVAAAMGQASA